jgi:hypothetical protein
MKKFKIYLSLLAVFALLFSSCSKDEQTETSDSEMATLSFGAIVNDLAAKSTNKQSSPDDLPDCSDDTPAYVRIVLLDGTTEVVGTAANPQRIDLVEGQIFTKEHTSLELEPGTYTLDHFAVYNANGDLIWLAPKGGTLASFVDSPLPMDINLGAGVKKYVDVSVLCYDNRDVNQYGYLFFELDTYEAFEYCVFANYCTPNGRHYPARYAMDVSIDGQEIYSGVINNVGTNQHGDFFADPLCLAFPNLPEYDDDEEYIDITLTLLDWDDNYGSVEPMVIERSLSRNDIMANFDGDDEVDYEHFRFGCGDDDQEPPVDSDNDGVIDSKDKCSNTPPNTTVDADGCPITQENDSDNDGIVDSIDQCENTPQGATVNAVGCPSDSDGDGVLDGIDQCENTPQGATVNAVGCPSDSDGDGVFNGIDQCSGTPAGATVNAVGCPSDSDNDGVLDGIDECENTPTGATVNEVGCEESISCSLPTIDQGCNKVYLAGNNNWIRINEPGGFPDPLFLRELGGQENFGSISTFIDNDGNVVIQINMDEGIDLDDYVVEVSDADDGTVDVCEVDSNVPEPAGDDPDATVVFQNSAISYPYFIRVRANACP